MLLSAAGGKYHHAVMRQPGYAGVAVAGYTGRGLPAHPHLMEHAQDVADASEDERLRSLMAAYQDGELAAFDGLYGLMEGDLRRFFAARCFNPERIEDLVQETFLQIHRSRRGYRRDLPVRPWVFAIATRVFQMYVRKIKRREAPEVSITESPEEPAVAGTDDRVVSRLSLTGALRQVPPEGRRAFLLHHWRGLSFREIADALHVEPGAVKLRSSRAARRLRALLGTKEEGHRD